MNFEAISAVGAALNVRAKSELDSQLIYRELKSGIMDGSYAAGSRLPTERALAEHFDAARNSVRKTLNLLEDEGLIVRHVGRGTFVRSAPAQDEFTLAELLEARLLFEPNLPDLVVERITPELIAEMEEALERVRDAESWDQFKEAKYALHMAIARGSRNRFIISIFEQIIASRRRAGWGRPGQQLSPVLVVRESAYRDNLVILDALRAGDADKAREAIRDYLLRMLSNVSSN
ncbi:DNA-binding FadR family transcriptional regulator [Devosia subaequoris]|uniref:DNA-binding FadR family transcriptional regulator n=1 Tax=Devosia subaequoris TaxID=395930 RepID=A0A7W6NCS2_9HYPH|nr:FCD domain-containing protein [Devosia subaequoris]MBB4053949.1 DNA-binding FadR family transcriptional regulator [Devosia subaequoris]MCP1211453.1 GntR family transcriptional regulator [Devosia subaequoris]